MSEELTLRCERCGRTGPDLLDCDQREAGLCPYRREDVGGGRIVRLVLALVLLALAAVFVAWGLMGGGALALLLGGVVGLVGLFALGLAVTSRSSPAVFHPDTAALWGEARTIRGPVTVTVLPPLPIDLTLRTRGAFTHPPSLAPLSREAPAREQAVAVFMAAMVGLLASGRLVPRRARQHMTGASSGMLEEPVDYVLAVGQDGPVEGVLDARIMDAVRDWQTHRLDEARTLKMVSMGLYVSPQHGMAVTEIVGAILGPGKSDPFAWVMNLVRKDAKARGLSPADLGADYATLRDLFAQLQAAQPDLARSLHSRLEPTIKVYVPSD
ncbi:MAG: hypothetical protein GYB65_14630 [Chloroflexi bacterium]|nr:hypothetical protein [Chloroflexota bacterium]